MRDAICHVKHTPMMWNYWHFSVRWKLGDNEYWNELSPEERKNWIKRLAHESRAHIQKYAFIGLPESEPLHENNFKIDT